MVGGSSSRIRRSSPTSSPKAAVISWPASSATTGRRCPSLGGSFLERHRFVDFALKVVGVGSVGTRCFVLVLQGRDENDPLMLQVKEATASVMEPYLPKSAFSNHGQRVVVGQQLMQATSDVFLGWTRATLVKKDFYVRQLWDMKGSIDTAKMLPAGLATYAHPLRLVARTRPCPDRRFGRDLSLSRQERHLRWRDRRLRRGLRRGQQARPRGVQGRHRRRDGVRPRRLIQARARPSRV